MRAFLNCICVVVLCLYSAQAFAGEKSDKPYKATTVDECVGEGCSSSSLSNDAIVCQGRQWKNPAEQLACKYPSPPIGRWAAVYTKEFAEAYDLPQDNISTDLSPGVDYMEMDVQPFNEKGVACLVNMLIKKPNDVAVYKGGVAKVWGEDFHKQRKLLQLIDVNEHKVSLREIATFGLTTRDNPYNPKRSYTIGSSFAFYAPDVLDGYDYVSANAGCYHIIKNKKIFPDGWAFNYAKASVWGRDQYRFSGLDDPRRPKGKAYYDSRVRINVPKEIISEVFKNMPIGGRK